HTGTMTQVGLNMGPRHARVLGWAKSYTKDLDFSTMVEHDTEIIGAVSLIWSILKSVMPADVTDHVEKKLDAEGLPRIATQNVAEDMGYCLDLNGVKYEFGNEQRGPPEAYLLRGYVT
ncbi:hypothetical protein DFH11DRAFT_1516595, partial [Phellopilus nigrolimitatus]